MTSRAARRIVLLIAAAASAGCVAPAERPGDLGLGPFRIRQTSPFEFTKASTMPRMPGTLAAGQTELSTLVTWTSRWANTDSRAYVGDGEAVWLTNIVSVGVTDRLSLAFELPAAWHGGGGLDGLIWGFHDLGGVTDNERRDFGRNGFRFELHDSDSDWIADADEKGAFFEDPFLRLSLLLSEGRGRSPRTSLEVMLRLGGGRAEEFLDDAGPELALGLTAAAGWGEWHGYAGLSRVFVAADEFGGIELADRRTEGFLAVEWEWRPGRSAVAQWLFSTGFAEDYHVYAESAHEVHVGLKWAAGAATTLEVAMIENFIHFDNSPDLGFHFGVSRRF